MVHIFPSVWPSQLGQVIEEKSGVSVQLKAVSQTLRDTQLNLSEVQNRYYWLENQVQTQQAPAQVCEFRV